MVMLMKRHKNIKVYLFNVFEKKKLTMKTNFEFDIKTWKRSIARQFCILWYKAIFVGNNIPHVNESN